MCGIVVSISVNFVSQDPVRLNALSLLSTWGVGGVILKLNFGEKN